MSADIQSNGHRNVVTLVGILTLGLLLYVSYSLYTGVALEDAFITYRYAQNLAAGHGFVFNPDERVFGTTSPLYAFVLAIFGGVFGVSQIPDISAVLAILCGLSTLAVWFLVLRRITGSWLASSLGPIVLMTSPIVLLTTCGGMETPLVLLLMSGSMLSMLNRRWILTGALLGLLILTRVDGAIWALLLFLYTWRQSRGGALREAIVAALCILPFVFFAYAYFGSPIPHTITAKRVIGAPVLFDPLCSPGRMKMYYQWWIQACRCDPRTVMGFAMLLGVVGVVRAKNAPGISLLAAFPAFYLLIMYLGRAPLYFEWYLAPVALFTSSLVALGIREFLAMLPSVDHLPANRYRTAFYAAVLLLPLGWIAVGDLRHEFERSRFFQRAIENGLRQPLGLWLRDNTPPHAVIAMEAIGYQGYFSDRRIIDLAGLVSLDVVRIQRTSRTNGEAFSRLLRELKPDYVVLRSFEVEQNRHLYGSPLFDNDEQRRFFSTRYREVKRFSAPIDYGPESYITVFGLEDTLPASDKRE